MSTSPVTLMVARRVADGRYQDLMVWLREGEQLATDFPGYLGSGVLAPPPDDDEFQIIFRFADEQTLHAWEHSVSRTAWRYCASLSRSASINPESSPSISRRAAAIATPSAAICCSMPDSQEGSNRPSESNRLRPRMARS